MWAVLRHADSTMFHARQCLEICERNDLWGWDRPFAYEALARAASVAGDGNARDRFIMLAKDLSAGIEDPNDLAYLTSELSTIP